MPYIDLRIHFTETVEDEDYTDYDPVSVERLDSTVPQEAIESIQEGLTQSDFGTIGFPYGIMDALSGGSITFNKRL